MFRLTGNPEDVAMPLAVGSSVAMIVPTAFLSARENARHGTVDARVLRAGALPILAGVGVGSALARVTEPEVFQIVFATVAVTPSVRMLACTCCEGKQTWRRFTDE